MTISLRPIHDSFGAEIVGVDLARPLDDEPRSQPSRTAWYRYSILLFRGVRMTPEQQIAFTRRLGPLHVMEPLEFNLPDIREIFVVSNVEEGGKAVGLKRAGWGWHSDGEDKAVPNAGSLLYAHEVPPAEGDTLFADTYAAFAQLPPDVRRAIAGRRACFSRVRLHHVHYPHMAPLTDAQKRNRPDVLASDRAPPSEERLDRALHRPLGVRDRSDGGRRKAASSSPTCIDFAHRGEFVYRHHWRVGDAILWDNRCTQHCATPFDDAAYRRLMHRTTLEGEVPLMAAEPVLRPAQAVAAE